MACPQGYVQSRYGRGCVPPGTVEYATAAEAISAAGGGLRYAPPPEVVAAQTETSAQREERLAVQTAIQKDTLRIRGEGAARAAIPAGPILAKEPAITLVDLKPVNAVTSSSPNAQLAKAQALNFSLGDIGGALGKLARGAVAVATGGTSEAIIAGAKSIGIVGAGAQGQCPKGFVRDESGNCVQLAQQSGTVRTLQTMVPGGKTGTELSGGAAVRGDFGVGVEPMLLSTVKHRCPRGYVLGVDNVCYTRALMPRNSRRRKWPQGRKPLFTSGDLNAIRRAASLAGRAEEIFKDTNPSKKAVARNYRSNWRKPLKK